MQPQDTHQSSHKLITTLVGLIVLLGIVLAALIALGMMPQQELNPAEEAVEFDLEVRPHDPKPEFGEFVMPSPPPQDASAREQLFLKARAWEEQGGTVTPEQKAEIIRLLNTK